MPDANALFSLAGRTAVLTGASAGLGTHLARVLSDAGARTVVMARRADALERLCQELPSTLAVPVDLADPDQVQAAAARALELLGGRVDLLVNNAAYVAGGVRAEDETREQIRRTLAVNLEAPVALAQAFFPGMRDAGGGVIVNITSMVASVGIGSFPQAIYAASKGGLEAVTREWAAQWARHGIRVNNLAPGFMDSEMTGEVIGSESVQAWIKRNTLIPRHGVGADLAGALLYLASDASSYVTGQTLRVDGGWTAH